jgi:hypothetical protein
MRGAPSCFPLALTLRYHTPLRIRGRHSICVGITCAARQCRAGLDAPSACRQRVDLPRPHTVADTLSPSPRLAARKRPVRTQPPPRPGLEHHTLFASLMLLASLTLFASLVPPPRPFALAAAPPVCSPRTSVCVDTDSHGCD